MAIYTDIFYQNAKLELDFNLDTYVKWVYQNIYQKQYKNHTAIDNYGIARLVHGIQHVTRAACYVPILINLYRMQGNKAALQLTATDVILLSIALLFHDSGREGEEIDLWDQDSAINLYYFLTKILQINKKKAIMLAEAIANKDATSDAYYILCFDSNNIPLWEKVEGREKNIYQKVIKDADCLDVIRARKIFDGKYLDILAKDFSNLDIISHLIVAVRKLIYKQGDKWLDNNLEIKRKYNNEDCFSIMVQDIEADPFLDKLYNKHQLVMKENLVDLTESIKCQKYNADLGLTANNLTHALLDGKLLFHGIELPTGLRNSVNHTEMEIKQTYKGDGKIGSANLIGYGAPLYCNAGFITLLDYNNLVSDVHIEKGLSFFCKTQTEEEKIQHLLNIQKLGGTGKKIDYQFGSYLATHVNLTYRFNNYHAVVFSKHRNYYNALHLRQKDGLAVHPNAPYLEAIFLQQQFHNITNQEIAIFEYFPIENAISNVVINDEIMLTMMLELCMSYIEKEIDFIYSNNLSLSEIKSKALYGNNINISMMPPDFLYKKELQDKINQAINNKLDCIIISNYSPSVKL